MPEPVLVVEDDPDVREVMMAIVESEGHRAVPAENGDEALQLLRAGLHPCLILLDLMMPVKDGWTTFEQLTQKNPTLPIILITARPNQLFPALASGVGALLEKPLDFVKLFDTVRSLLEEPDELRIARMTGRTSLFRFIPPKTDEPTGKAA